VRGDPGRPDLDSPPSRVSTPLPEALRALFRRHEEFWRGEGPCLLLFAQPHLARGRPYRCHDLVVQHRDAAKNLEERLTEIEPHLGLVDDGIPTFRADLGTTLLPSALGLDVKLQPELHPWLAGHLTAQELLGLPSPILPASPPASRAPGGGPPGEIGFAVELYRLLLRRQGEGAVSAAIRPYVPDTQGVLDLAHLILGTDLFVLLADRPQDADALLDRCLELFLAGTRLFKELLAEGPSSMVHGHGMPVGVWFPGTGARISEDSATLLSEQMIRRFVLPGIREASRPFGRLFLHFCGHHPGFLRLACELSEVSTVNLGNPEMYDLEEVFALCGRTRTVYLGHLPLGAEEDGEAYLERLAALAGRHGTRLILVSDDHPADAAEKRALIERWHRLTTPRA
jgi:hypothetical protein